MEPGELSLSINDRLYISQILPTRGNEQDLFIIKDIKNKIDFNKEEKKDIDYKISNIPNYSGTMVSWNQKKKDILYNIEFSSSEIRFLKSTIDTLDSKKELKLDWLDTIQKIKSLS